MAVRRSAVKKRKDIVRVERGQAHIQCSYNNTITTITDMQGNAISWSSAGKLHFRGSKKNTPYVAQMVAEDAAKVAVERGLRYAEVYVKGIGQGKENAIRALANAGITITLIKDVSPIPHNGCRPPKRRRI